MDPAALVDLDRHPSTDPGRWARARADLASDGVTVLPGFLRPVAVAAMVAEVDGLAAATHPSDVHGPP